MNNTQSNYLDFDLEIISSNSQSNSYRLQARTVGEGDTTTTIDLSNRQEIETQAANLRNFLFDQDDKPFQQFGSALFNSFIVGRIRDHYQVTLNKAESQRQGLRLRLHIEPSELAVLPWEFLYDPNRQRFIALYNDTIIRYQNLLGNVQPLVVEAPLRILAMTANPVELDKLDIAEEKQRIEIALHNLQASGQVQLSWVQGQTWRDLQQALQNETWHIFHYVGHGGFDQTAKEGTISLADENGHRDILSAHRLSMLLNEGNLRLVVLNSCKGAYLDKTDAYSSTAAVLTQQGIPAVLAMQYAVSDKAAIELSRSFYSAIAKGLTFTKAVTESRKAINLAIHDAEWATPVLYTRAPDGVLLNVQQQAQATPTEPAKTVAVEKTVKSTGANAMSEQPLLSQSELRKLITTSFSMGELKGLCQDLDVDFDSLSGDNRDGKALELVSYMKRRNRLPELQSKVQETISERD